MSNRVELLRNLLGEAEAALEEAEQARKVASEQEGILRAEVEGLRIALAAHAPKPQTESLFTKVTNGAIAVIDAGVTVQQWKNLPRTDAIVKVYSEVGKPLHRKELTGQLRMRGRDDDLSDVSAALAYLKRVGRAESLGQGRWLVRASSNGNAPSDQGGDA